jgi:ABC-type lipoprotein export system ATPase subunit
VTALVEARDLSVRYGQVPVLNGVDLELDPGDEVALVGRSGSGKTTLLLALAGLLPAGGSLRWPGLPADADARRASIGVVFQAPSLIAELTARENVALPLRLRGGARGPAYRAAEEALVDLALGDAIDALPAELSGGQQQRVAVARVLAGDPQLVLADEPTGALDPGTATMVIGVLRARLHRGEGALLLATHDEDLASLLPKRLELSDGSIRQNSGVTR